MYSFSTYDLKRRCTKLLHKRCNYCQLLVCCKLSSELAHNKPKYGLLNLCSLIDQMCFEFIDVNYFGVVTLSYVTL